MELTIVPFEPAHVAAMEPREFEAKEMAALGDLPERYRAYMDRGMAYTGLLDGQVLACAGIVLLWPGVGEAWSITTPLVEAHPLQFHRALSRCLEIMFESMKLWRLQVAINARHAVSQKWVERLGFTFEGFMPGYGPDGADYIRFSRLRLPGEE